METLEVPVSAPPPLLTTVWLRSGDSNIGPPLCAGSTRIRFDSFFSSMPPNFSITVLLLLPPMPACTPTSVCCSDESRVYRFALIPESFFEGAVPYNEAGAPGSVWGAGCAGAVPYSEAGAPGSVWGAGCAGAAYNEGCASVCVGAA